MNGEPAHDYLAFPLAPLVLLLQAGFMFLPRRWLRMVLAVAAVVAIFVMRQYVRSIPTQPEEGANIGAGLMEFWLVGSWFLFAAALVRELVPLALRRLTR